MNERVNARMSQVHAGGGSEGVGRGRQAGEHIVAGFFPSIRISYAIFSVTEDEDALSRRSAMAIYSATVGRIS